MTVKDDSIDFLATHITTIIWIVALLVLIGIVAQASVSSQQSVKEEYKQKLILEEGSMDATMDLTSGAQKPLVTHQDRVVAEVSGWSSDLTVNGNSKPLWRHQFDYSKDSGRDTLYYTRGGSGYEIQQTVTVKQRRVIIEYHVIPTATREIDDVTLALSHYRWHYSNVSIENETAHVQYTEGGRKYAATIDLQGPVVETYVNPTENGPNYFTATYTVVDPTPNEKTLLAREVIRIDGQVEASTE